MRWLGDKPGVRGGVRVRSLEEDIVDALRVKSVTARQLSVALPADFNSRSRNLSDDRFRRRQAGQGRHDATMASETLCEQHMLTFFLRLSAMGNETGSYS